MIAAIVRDRNVTADFMWAFLISERILPTRGNEIIPGTQAKMLEMWHSGDVCYAKLEEEIAALGEDNQFAPVVYRQYLDHIDSSLSPCLDERLPLVDAQRFFDNPTAVRTERITRWFDASWSEVDEGASDPTAEHCDGILDAHLPDAVASADAEQLSTIWSTALNERFRCQFEGMNHANQLADLGDSHLFTLSSDERTTIVTLQMTLYGHVIAIGSGRQYGGCWPAFETRASQAAAATDPTQLTGARNAALEDLYSCVNRLPVTNPFTNQP